MQGCGSLSGTVSDPDGEVGRVIVEDCENQGRTRFRSRIDVVRKMTPDDFPSCRFSPPLGPDSDHEVAGSVSNKLDLIECLVPCGACFLICLI